MGIKREELTDREQEFSPLSVASEFQSKFGAKTMLRLEAVMRLNSELRATKFKNLKKERSCQEEN